MIKVIFFDVDGTLLPYGWERPPESTLAALRSAREQGILLFLCTGRMKALTDPFREWFPFDGYLSLNGQYCYDQSGKVLRCVPFSKETAKEAFSVIQNASIPCLFQEGEAFFYLNDHPALREFLKENRLPFPPLYPPEHLETHDLLHILIFEFEKNAPLLSHVPGLSITSGGFDVIPQGGGKETGMKEVAKRYGITCEEIMAFGDGDNDAGMLAGAGLGVAMENGSEKAKKAADYITSDAREDGIYEALRHFGVVSLLDTRC